MTTTTAIRDVVGEVSIVERPDQHRYELRVDGEVRGLIVYCDDGPVRALVHTEIDARLQGQGLAGDLTRRALLDIAAAGKRVQPACGYAAHYIERHPDFAYLVA